MEAAEEEEQKLQQAAAAAAAAGPVTGSPRAEPEAEAAPAAKSRWEVMDGEEEESKQQQEEKQRQQQQQQQQQQHQQHSRQHPPVPKREQLRFINPTLAADLDALTSEELERKCRVNGLSNKGSKQLCMERILALDYYLHADERGPLPSLEAIAAATTPAARAGGSSWQPVDEAAGAGPAAAGGPEQQLGRRGSSGRWSSGTISIPLGGPLVKQEDGAPADALAGQQQPSLGQPSAAAAAAAASRWQVVDEEAEKQAQPQVPISKWLQEEADAEALRKVCERLCTQNMQATISTGRVCVWRGAGRGMERGGLGAGF